MNCSNSQKAAMLQLVLVMAMAWATSSGHAQGTVIAEAVPSDPTPARGARITVDINIDVSATNPARLLASYTGSLRWDRELIKYESHSGTKAPFTGVVNVMDAGGLGSIAFNGANPAGASGISNVLTVVFTAISPNGVNVVLDLEFTAMLAALDFTNLLPVLSVRDGAVTTAVRDAAGAAALPQDFALRQNYPNPFNPETIIRYEVPRPSRVVLTIFNVMGQKVGTLVNVRVMPGRYAVSWNGRDENGRKVPSGVYTYRMEVEGNVYDKKMVLLQ